MLFDLSSGRRKRVVQVVYAVLALLMGGSLLLFGIGSDAPGGLLDAVGLGGGSNSSSSPQYQEQIDKAEERLAKNPDDQQAMLDLVRYHYLSATTGIETNPQTLQVSISDDAHSQLEDTVAAWEDYLKTKPENTNVSAATSASAAYRYLNDAGGAAGAQEVVAESQRTASAYDLLARYLYADFQYAAGDEAAAKAAAAAEPAQRKQVEKNLAAFEESAHKYEKRLEKVRQKGSSKQAEQQLQDPFGSLGVGGAPPASP